MKLKEALQRIEALEREVAALKARPEQHVHYHSAPPGLAYIPPVIIPQTPYPWLPSWPTVTCGAGGEGQPSGYGSAS